METQEILKVIKKLPVNKQMFIIEKTLKSIRVNDTKKKMKDAADAMYSEYTGNPELTEFTVLDCGSFYETRWNLVDFPESHHGGWNQENQARNSG